MCSPHFPGFHPDIRILLSDIEFHRKSVSNRFEEEIENSIDRRPLRKYYKGYFGFSWTKDIDAGLDSLWKYISKRFWQEEFCH